MSAANSEKLNRDLCPDQFEILVPQDCKLFGDISNPKAWKRFLVEMNRHFPIPGFRPQDLTKFETGYTCDCRKAWKLEGARAEAFAAKVHDRIHRQLLALREVSAVDVGFAISEHESRFENMLSLRIHVAQKRSPVQLRRAGYLNLVDPRLVFKRDLSFLRWVEGPDSEDIEEASSRQADRQCPHYATVWVEFRRRMAREIRRKLRNYGSLFAKRYPIAAIHDADLNLYCPSGRPKISDLRSVRLCICGVPLDIINSRYNPSITHPGGDADAGVFAERPQRSDQLSDQELQLIGTGRVNPLVGGVSVGTITGQAGTLGGIVWDRTDGTPCVLSNWHVLASTPTAQVGQPVFQPALFDGGTETDVVARLKRWSLEETGDVALAEISGARHYASGEILGLWSPLAGYVAPRLNQNIRKWGRTTGFTRGFIDGLHLATNIDYGNGVVRYFRDQFHIAPLYLELDVSQAGDSGSLVIASYNPLVQREYLTKMIEWLRLMCRAYGLEPLKKEIRGRLVPWFDRLRELGLGPDSNDLIAYNSAKKIERTAAAVDVGSPSD
ncbi:MAG: hypothetical protein AAF725_07945, partial [Acidobacteriota bacterium]